MLYIDDDKIHGFTKVNLEKHRAMLRIAQLLLLLLCISIPWQNAFSGYYEKWQDSLQFMPQYCQDRALKEKNRQVWDKWAKRLGKVHIHMHHYCEGVYFEIKAKSAVNRKEKESFLNKTARQMAYVSKYCSRSCILYPELHTRWGWALGENGQVADAIKHYQMAIQAKPKYVPAYIRLSDLYLVLGQGKKAKSILKQGLKANPKSSMLKRHLEELDASK